MADTHAIFKDYKHASMLFVDDHFNFLPKSTFLYHVYFDLNINNFLYDSQNPNSDRELGLLVKNVSLPKFSVDSKIFNAYNRPNIVQTKIKYDPVQIGFHDDSADLVRNFWFDYYNYYYRDSDHAETLYHQEHKYQDTVPTSGWGYTTRSNNSEPYIKSIRIYSLHHKRFSEYILINPIIKSFKHGEHAADQTTSLMTHEMTIDYETVLYAYGAIGQSTVAGFADLHYDLDPSPLTAAGGGSLGVYDTSKEIVNDVRAGEYTLAAKAAGNGLAHGFDYVSDATKRGFNAVSNWVDQASTAIHDNINTNSSVFVPSEKIKSFNTGINGTTTTTNSGTRSGMDYAKNLKPGQNMKFTYTDEGGFMPIADEVTSQSVKANGPPQSATRVLAPDGAVIPAKSGKDTVPPTINNSQVGGTQRAGKIHYPGNWNDTRIPPPRGYDF
jgi:hypothetical protein